MTPLPIALLAVGATRSEVDAQLAAPEDVGTLCVDGP